VALSVAEGERAMSRDHRHRGTSLIELVIVISMSFVVLALVGVMLNGMWRTQRVMADHQATMNSIERFAQQFRQDAHTARDANLVKNDSADALQFQQNGKLVEYSVANSRVERTVKKADAVAARETYVLPDDSLVKFAVSQFEAGRLASVEVKYPPIYQTDPDVTGRREFQIEAAISASNSPSQPTGVQKQ
jgi:type II secretory pathway component PulJ